MDLLNEKLVTVKEQQRKKQKWESQLDAYQSEAKEKQNQLERLKLELDVDEKDIEKLSNFSFTNLFYTIIGKKEERLDKEKQALLLAHVKFDEVNRALIQIGQKTLEISQRLKALPDVERNYQEVLEEKERLIKDASSPLTEEYYALSHEIAELKAKAKETLEAIKAGELVRSTLDAALESLQSAENWGTFDLLGGGMVSTAVKHNHMEEAEEAKELIYDAQANMRSFQKELGDIEINADMAIDISCFLNFADYFFDGFISDWMVQGRIDDSIDKVGEQLQRIETLLSELHRNDAEINRKVEKAEAQRTHLIENA